jgi:hypothetical protein
MSNTDNYDQGNSYTLENARELNRKYPNTFVIPISEEIAQLEAGRIVRLIIKDKFGSEKIWVHIDSEPQLIGGHLHFSGCLDDIPAIIRSLKHKDKVYFAEENIMALYF